MTAPSRWGHAQERATHRHDHAHEYGSDGPPASASATTATITARLDLTGWEIATAQEPRRTLTGPGGREVTLRDVDVRATRRQ